MTSTLTPDAAGSESDDVGSRVEALVGRMLESMLGAMDLFAVELGRRLGLYSALADGGPATSRQLADRAGIAERYAREWLEQQAVTGLLDVDDVTAAAAERRYALPAHAVPVLLDATSPAYLAPAAAFLPPLGRTFDAIVEAYRTGAGLTWSQYPVELMQAQAALNRPAFLHELAGWLAAVPDIDAALRGNGRVADLACGAGWSTQAIARAYPTVTVDGFDADEASIAAARAQLADSDLGERVRFVVRDLAAPGEGAAESTAEDRRYEVATMFEALHDMSQPVAALRAVRQMLRPGGLLLVADERAAETFTAPGDPFERLFYGSSLLVCLPTSLADGGVGTGAAMRPSTVAQYAAEAGFAACEVLPIQHMLFRFYLLRAGG